MVKEEKNFIELALGKIQSDIHHMKIQLDRVESFTYSLSKRITETEKTLTGVKVGFYVFCGVISIIGTVAYVLK